MYHPMSLNQADRWQRNAQERRTPQDKSNMAAPACTWPSAIATPPIHRRRCPSAMNETGNSSHRPVDIRRAMPCSCQKDDFRCPLMAQQHRADAEPPESSVQRYHIEAGDLGQMLNRKVTTPDGEARCGKSSAKPSDPARKNPPKPFTVGTIDAQCVPGRQQEWNGRRTAVHTGLTAGLEPVHR